MRGGILEYLPRVSEALPHPSATVVLLREVAGEIEVLLVRRAEGLAFHGGAWVFPGGRIDAGDRERAGSEALVEAARHAAVREAEEEAGLTLEPQALRPFAEWITPEGRPKRFRTWFFVGRVTGGAVRIDGNEVVDYRWTSPRLALLSHRAGDLELPPPTFVTLTQLSSHGAAAAAVQSMTAKGIAAYHPRPRAIDGGLCSVYQGDAAYDGGDLDAVGPRHRLVMIGNDWRYERNY
jgi:8-oxo-dGTP pyrophosphatase MutT (NUDIX family)